MSDREPASPEERKKANVMGWGTAVVVTASLVMMVLFNIALNAGQVVLTYSPALRRRDTTML